MFSAAPAPYATLTLLEALGNGGGGIEALLRQAIAALLSATQPFIAYPYAAVQVIALTNAALLSGSSSLVESQKHEFDRFNNYEADIDQFGRPPTMPGPVLPPTEPPPPPPPAPVLPTLTISDVAVNEGRNGSTTATVTITLSAASTSTVTVTVGVTGGTATSGTDFSGGSAVVLTFSPGQTTKTFSISVKGDRTPEPNETVLVTLSGVNAAATIADAQGVITIVNDDGSPLLAAAAGPGGGREVAASDLDAALAEALAAWGTAGAALGGVSVVVTDFDENVLGAALDGRTIALDRDGAAWGWTHRALVAVLTHELGHLLGFEHAAHGVMAAEYAMSSPAESALVLRESALVLAGSPFVSAESAVVRGGGAPGTAQVRTGRVPSPQVLPHRGCAAIRFPSSHPRCLSARSRHRLWTPPATPGALRCPSRCRGSSAGVHP